MILPGRTLIFASLAIAALLVLVSVWQWCYQRSPSKAELRTASDFVRDNVKYLYAHPERVPADRSPELQSLTNLAQVLMSSNEFLYVD